MANNRNRNSGSNRRSTVNRPSWRQGLTHGLGNNTLALYGLVTLVLAAGMLILIAQQLGFMPSKSLMLLIIAAVLLLALFYRRGMQQSNHRHKLNTREVITEGPNIWIADDEFNRDIRGRLTEKMLKTGPAGDDSAPIYVYLATRNHVIQWRLKLIPIVVLELTASGFLFGWHGRDFAEIWLVSLLVAGIAAFSAWVKWKYTYLVVSDTYVTHLPSFPPWLWWLESDKEPIPLRKIDEAKSIDTLVGNYCNYGTLTIDTASDQDAKFHGMRWIPRHELVIGIIQSAMESAAAR